MGMYGSAPTPPDPAATAAAQAGLNRDAVKASAEYNQINQVGPYGSQSWSGDIGSPNRTVTTTLSPDEQAKYDIANKVTMGLGAHVDNRLGQVTDTPFNVNTGVPARQFGGAATQFDMSAPITQAFSAGGPIGNTIADAGAVDGSIANAGPINSTVANAGHIQRGFAPSGPIQNNIAPQDWNASVKSAQDAVYGQAQSRLDPQFQQAQTALETKLANQGITATSNPAAYQQEMDNFSRQKNDAYTSAQNQAVTTGIGLQGQLFGQNATAGQFANTAQQQGYDQSQGRAAFTNQAQAQQYGQNANQTQLEMQGQAQQIGQNQSQTQSQMAAQAQRFGQNATQLQAQNAAQAQQFGQNAAGAQFFNDAAGQLDAVRMAQAQFGNAALMQNQNSTNTARDAGINENILARNQPINEVNALISGNQVNTPQFGSPSQYSVNAADITTPTMQNYQAAVARQNGIFGALGSVAGAAGSAAIMSSSKDYKTDKRPAESVLDKIATLPVDRWKYKPQIADEGRHIGPYAEDWAERFGGDGKGINMIDAIGVILKGLQELTVEVRSLKAARA